MRQLTKPATWPVDSFIAANDFTGKTVVPFCTSSSSGLGESGELLAETAGTGEWLVLCMVVLFAFCLAGCGAEEEPDEVWDSISYEGSKAPEEFPSEETVSGKQEDSSQESSEEADMSADAGASVVVKYNEKMGNTEYVEKITDKLEKFYGRYL